MLAHPAATSARLLAELSARAAALLDAAGRVRGRSDDEAIHDLRVAIRRLAGTLSLWRTALDEAPSRRARRSLARLRRRLGVAREREVHIALLSALETDAAPEIADAVRLLRHRLESRIARPRDAAARIAGRRRIARILRRVESAGAGLAARVAATPGLVPHTAGRAARQLADARAALAHAGRVGDDEALHAARVAAKKARYALESLAAVGVREDEAAERELRRAQRELGVVHDWVTLKAWIERVRLRRARHASADVAAELPLGNEDRALAALLERVDEHLVSARDAFFGGSSGPGSQREAGA